MFIKLTTVANLLGLSTIVHLIMVFWCQDGILSLNVSKVKELVINFRKQGDVHVPVCISGAEVESVRASSCPDPTTLMLQPRKTSMPRLPLRASGKCLRRCANFYGCFAAWYRNRFVPDGKM